MSPPHLATGRAKIGARPRILHKRAEGRQRRILFLPGDGDEELWCESLRIPPLKYPLGDKVEYFSKKTEGATDKGGTVILYGLLDMAEMEGLPSDPAVLAQIRNSDLIAFEKARFTMLAVEVMGVGYISSGNYYFEAGLGYGIGTSHQEHEKNGTRKSGDATFEILSYFMDTGYHFKNSMLGLSYRLDEGIIGVRSDEATGRQTAISLAYSVTTIYFGYFF